MDAKVIDPSAGKLLDVLGVNHTILLAGEDTNHAYSLVRIDTEPGLGIPPHVHKNEDETFYVMEGQVSFMKEGGDPFVAGAGTIVHLPRGVPHAFGGSEHAGKLLLVISPAGLEQMFYKLAEFPPGPPDIERLTKVCNEFGISLIS